MSGLNPTIPLVDMLDWTATGEGSSEKKANFVAAVGKALHEVGFFGVVNAGTDATAVDAAYATMAEFFSAPLEKKDECRKVELAGERGYVHSETAQGQTRKDHKEFYHVGPIEQEVTEEGASETSNIFPTWMDMENPAKALLRTLNKSRSALEEAMSLAMGEERDYLTSLSTGSSALLRALHYPSNPNPGHYWGAPHTDIGMFTILPRATEEGLQVFLPHTSQQSVNCNDEAALAQVVKDEEGEWIPVQVPPNALIINCGDKLQAMTNGYFRSSIHRIIAKPNVERYSMVYFVHSRNECSVAPRPNSLTLGGTESAPLPNLFPLGVTSNQMLMHRLQELGLCPPEWDSHYATSVGALVRGGVAHPAMLRTWHLWGQMKARAEQKKE